MFSFIYRLKVRKKESFLCNKLLDAGVFDIDFYMSANPDVVAKKINPTVHFIRHGIREGRAPSLKIDIFHYTQANPVRTLDDVEALVDRLASGVREAHGAPPTPPKEVRVSQVETPGIAARPQPIESPSIDRLRNAYVTPYIWRNGLLEGGIAADCPNARMFFGDAFRDRPPDTVDCDAAIRVCGRYLYAGPIWNHFGHVLTESLHRIWAHDDHDGIVFNGVIGFGGVYTEEKLRVWTLPGYVRQLIDLIGIRPKQLIVVSRPMIFEHLDVPPAGAVWGRGVEPFYLSHLRRYQDSIRQKTAGIDTPKRIYYSRRHLLPAGAAGIIGSSFIEAELKNTGFEVVQPERQPLARQFANVLNAETIVFDEGSALHVTELVREITAPIYMLPRRPGEKVFSRALEPRANFLSLVDDSQIRILPDANGKLASPTAITYYEEPQAVFDAMARHGLAKGTFSTLRYKMAEMTDLERCKANRPDIRASRIRTIRSVRAAASPSQPPAKEPNMGLLRYQVVQKLLGLFENPNYLEVGVNAGATFAAIKAERKVAVDPQFRFDKTEWAERYPNAEFHEVTSDAFFAQNKERFNVIYLDGLHTFEQTLRDFNNAIMCLKEDGIILIDDTVPSSYTASMPDLNLHLKMRKLTKDPSGAWMGDVYRLVFFIQTFFQQFSYATARENHGQTVVWRKVRPAGSFPERSVSSVGVLPYEDVILSEESLRMMEMNDIIREIRAARD